MSETQDEYEEIDYSDDKMYCILRALFEDDEGLNVCDHLRRLTEAVADNTRMMKMLLSQKVKIEKSEKPEKKVVFKE